MPSARWGRRGTPPGGWQSGQQGREVMGLGSGPGSRIQDLAAPAPGGRGGAEGRDWDRAGVPGAGAGPGRALRSRGAVAAHAGLAGLQPVQPPLPGA